MWELLFDGDRKGGRGICYRRHASAMLRIAAVLSSLNCILRRNYLAKDRRAQNALLVSWCPPRLYLSHAKRLPHLRQPLFCLYRKFYLYTVPQFKRSGTYILLGPHIAEEILVKSVRRTVGILICHLRVIADA